MKSSAMTLDQADWAAIEDAGLQRPDGGDEGQAGEGVPLLGQVVIDEFFAGALEAVDALFKGEQGGVADEDGGVGFLKHDVEIGSRGQEGNVRIAPLVKEDAGVGQRGAAGRVGGY